MVWLFTRPMRLEITQTQVRAFHGSVIKKAATTAGKAVYKASGIQTPLPTWRPTPPPTRPRTSPTPKEAAASRRPPVTCGNKIQPAGTNRPRLQLGLGAASGGIGNLADGAVSGKRGWTLVENTAWGAVTGAAGNLGGGTLKSTLINGFASGFGDAVGTDVINTHRLPTSGPVWIGTAIDGGLGAVGNTVEAGISANSTQDATMGNSWGVGLSAYQGLMCGGLDRYEGANC